MQKEKSPPKAEGRLCVAVTGHRSGHASFAGRADIIEAVLRAVLHELNAVNKGAMRVHTMLADGVDQIAARIALDAGWEHVAPLPFGAALTAAFGGPARTRDERARALAEAVSVFADGGAATSPDLEGFASLARQSRVFALAEQDEAFAALWLDAAEDARAQQRFAALSSARYALAARIAIEQSDVLIAVWDGATHAGVGGTGDTVRAALDAGAPVIWINPATASEIRVLTTHEDLCEGCVSSSTNARQSLSSACAAATASVAAELSSDDGVKRYYRERRRRGNNPLWRGYRVIENVFGASRDSDHQSTKIAVSFKHPREHGADALRPSAETLETLLGPQDPWLAEAMARFPARFGWADTIATGLSDAYRGGMVLSFTLAACAVLANLANIPLGIGQDWMYTLAELVLISGVIFIAMLGIFRHWHRRWFESRRIAEYLRHSFYLAPLGVMRAAGRWPRGLDTSWPEEYVRATLREIGLPGREIDAKYVRGVLFELILPYVLSQRDYHRGKAKRLHRVHRQLDLVSVILFVLAFLVALYQLVGNLAGAPPPQWAAPWLTFISVALPMLGAIASGVRFFGDFERFAAISDVAERNLTQLADRIQSLHGATFDYDTASRLAHGMESVFVQELESWQAIFGGKQMGVA